MKNKHWQLFILTSIFCFLNLYSALSQACLIQHSPEAIRKHKIKTISIKLKSGTHFKDHDSLEVTKVEFAKDGKIIYSKYFQLFGVILYSREYQNTYNDLDLLYEKIEIHTDYPKSKQDSSLLGIAGYEPNKSKWIYEYDTNCNLLRIMSKSVV